MMKVDNDTKQFIEERIIDVEKELIAAEEDLKVFMDRNRRIENSPALQLEQQRLGREVTVLTGVFTTLKQQLETTKIEEVKEIVFAIFSDMQFNEADGFNSYYHSHPQDSFSTKYSNIATSWKNAGYYDKETGEAIVPRILIFALLAISPVIC